MAIVDHHEDRGRHLQVDGPDREIAFCSGEGLGRATVASTCTLCAERVCPSKTYMGRSVGKEAIKIVKLTEIEADYRLSSSKAYAD